MTGMPWRDIPGWSGIYQVRADGRVRSIARTARCGSTGQCSKAGKVLQPFKNKRGGTARVCLYRDGQKKKIAIRQLVELAFPDLPYPTRRARALPAHRNGLRMIWSAPTTIANPNAWSHAP